jgi:hypothetical protein
MLCRSTKILTCLRSKRCSRQYSIGIPTSSLITVIFAVAYCRVVRILNNYTIRYFILMNSKTGLTLIVIGIVAVLMLVLAETFGNQAIVSVVRATALPIQGNGLGAIPNGAVVGVTANPNAITFGKNHFPNVTAITIPSTSKSSSGPSSSSSSSGSPGSSSSSSGSPGSSSSSSGSPGSSSSSSGGTSGPSSSSSSSGGTSGPSSMHVTHVTVHHHKKHKGGHGGPSGPGSSSGY